MSSKYDDDDEITPEDEEKINILIPVIKADLQEYTGFSDLDIKDTLWNNYLEIEPTIKELKSKLAHIE
ncbi:hypothetical protein WICMUC_001276 [Wickerhamomyces mucosus]|uniref:HBS1-like protein N-terminal domain-containing protein n=1 Tax=Wickerhamomyces mucosus TaxID=1378264 RepID=A0A9P8PWY8_9ASCO|nr:hypothetical protein WICMUC_001276 [Wickerhamomyces mucosus]